MIKSRFGYRTRVPNITTNKAVTKPISFTDGLNTYKDNDDLKVSELPYATDARFSKIGRYKTRRGADRWSVPIGEAINVQQNSVAGASNQNFSVSILAAEKLTTTSAGRATRAAVNIQNANAATGVIFVELYSDDSDEPGDLLARSSIAVTDVGGSYAYEDAYFIEAPLLDNATPYWVLVKVQDSGSGNFEISTTTNTSNAATSTDSGATWTQQAYSLNVKLYTSTDAGVKGLYKAYRPDGTKVTFMAHGTSVYTINDSTGVTTEIDSGLSSSATRYRFQMVQDAVYYVNGQAKPRKYDFSTVTELTDADWSASLILEHKGLLFFVDTTDKTRLFYTNFADFTTFTSTDFIYVPAPKSYDSIVCLMKLNGVLFPFSKRNKFMLLGSDNATFQLDEATSQKGTFSQESAVADANYIWFASDDGIYQFNGTSEKNIAEGILEDYLALPNKESICTELYNNRLYVFYTPVGGADNTRCFVYNILLDKWESQDLGTFVGRTFGRYAQEDIFLLGSNRVGAIYKGELSTNDYHNMGDILRFELRTGYSHFGNPATLKRIPEWRPGFSTGTRAYNVQCGYAVNFQDSATYQDISLGSGGLLYDDGNLYDTGLLYSGVGNIDPRLFIPGSYQRIQRRYKHHAAREPVEMLHEILAIESQRL
jgi:hypothetical protein